MPPAGYFIDANLLVLLVVGDEDRGLITRHRRLRGYTADDYDRLLDITAAAERVFVTPNTLTEASNLLARTAPGSRALPAPGTGSALLIHESEEVVVSSSDASSNTEFRRLGLTDAALLQVVTADTPVITVDLGLYVAAAREDPSAALNFPHYRGL